MSDASDSAAPSGLPEGPPWSVDTLADIQAGLYPPAMTAILRHQILMDPEAAAVWAALVSLTDDLHDLDPNADSALAPPMPAEFSERLDKALSAEVNNRFASRRTQPVWPSQHATVVPADGARAAGSPPLPPAAPFDLPARGPHTATPTASNVFDLESARRKRRTTWLAAIGGVAAAAVIGTVVVIGVGSSGRSGGADSASALPSRSAPAAVAAQQEDSAAAEAAPNGATDPRPTTPGSPPGSAAAAGSAAADSPGSTAASTTASTGSTQASGSSTSAGQPAPGAGPPAADFETELLILDSQDVADSYDQIAGRNVVLSDSGEPAVMAQSPLGPIADPAIYAGCVAANGVDDQLLVGLRMVRFNDRQGYALAFDDPDNPIRSTILVVGLECGPENADLLIRVTAQR